MNGVFSACSCTSLVASFISSDRSLDLQGKSSKTDVSAVALLWQNRSWLSRKKGGAWDGRKRSRTFPRATGGKWGALASQTLSRARTTDRLHPEVRAGACRSLQSRNRNSMPKSKGRNTILFWQKKKIFPLVPIPLSPFGAVCLGSFHVSPCRFTPPLPCCFCLLVLSSFPSAPSTVKLLSWAAQLPHPALYCQAT